MSSRSTHSPSSRALIAFPFIGGDSAPSARFGGTTPELDEGQWQPILHSSNQVVLYNPRSHALSITAASSSETVLPGVVVARRQRRESDRAARAIGTTCPYCKQTLPTDFSGFHSSESHVEEEGGDEIEGRWEENVDSSPDEYEEVTNSDPAYHSRASDYFRLLAIANETSSRRPSRSPSPYRVDNGRATSTLPTDENRSTTGAFPAEKMAEGYFKTFFQEEYKLGMGANGTVFLCQHVLDGNPLGHFAVKKIAVGESHSYLVKILKEVRLLERLHHPNIITYHHAWLENSQFSSFGPKVPTLHVLMQWAEGGSLDDFIDVRLGRKAAHAHMHPLLSTSSTFDPSGPPSPDFATSDLPSVGEPSTSALPNSRYGPQQPQHPASLGSGDDPQSRGARIRAFRALQRAPPEEKERMRREMEALFGPGLAGGRPVETNASGVGGGRTAEWKPVHLLSAQEVKSLFRDVVEGLAFLHDKSILHLDLKPGNVLLTWDEGKLIPRAMLSDFGTSRDMINSTRAPRSGNTGTLEYTAPETLPSPHTGLLQQIDSKADMWSLGMILHKLLFFKLPYRYAAAGDATGEPISREDESVKMDKLEKEVLDYPGFKSTPNLVIGFETRRLPRAYLVLLESLLYKSPAGRPSCERVSTAIREGKLDPLEETITSPSTMLSVGRPRANTITSATPIPEPLVPLAATEPLSSETTRLLALPPPDEILGPEQRQWRMWLSRTLWIYHSALRLVFGKDVLRPSRRRPDSVVATRRWRVGMRLFRSVVLVAKVMSIARVCRDPLTCSRPWVIAFLFAGALADTVFDHEAMYTLRPGEMQRRYNDLHDEKRSRRERRARLQRRAMRSVCVTVGLAVLHVALLGVGMSDMHEGMVGGIRSLFIR
ncbi:kinase-like protein [Pholiota conissans]|uniref:non-specific serine/threonine protein kinase n=1 Tax=Pholiota conissans TaxID=109636 RepID=A0A9P5Z8E7_9AGAR|nr:kinase-like protein [Pholiota conissans]